MERFEPGHPISVAMFKWGDKPHWHWDGVYLGADEHGEWLGYPVGTAYARPGLRFATDFDGIGLVPHRDAAHFVAFNRPTDQVRSEIYVDMTTPPEWVDTTVRCIDLDLDVVRRWTGETQIIDQDEFEQHQIEFGYPPEIITMTEESAERVYEAVKSENAPYDLATRERWFEVLASLKG